ncbi:HMG domain-containing protein 3-like, partial [Saccoglossus kowalevskii]
ALSTATTSSTATSATPTLSEICRQSTVKLLLDKTIPYDEEYIKSILCKIKENDVRNTWPVVFEPENAVCENCSHELELPTQRKGKSLDDMSYLITFLHFKQVSVKVRYCPSKECGAMNMVMPINQGLINIADKMIVSLEIFVHVRNCMKNEAPVRTALDSLMSTLMLKS